MLKVGFAARVAVAVASVALALQAEPAPGDLFREYSYTVRFGEVHPGATRKNIDRMLKGAMAERLLQIPSVSGVVRAEVSIEYWGGHIGTSDQKFQVNGGEWVQIPQPSGTPTRPQCYYRTILGRATVPLPVESLKAGGNAFRFTAGPQLCYSFGWGFYWVYGFTVRLYYDPKNPPEARIASPVAGSEIGDYPRLVAEARHPSEPITKVEFLAHYEDFNWEGDGNFRQWHYITERGALARHIGTATAPPYAVTWDTAWVPDQEEPVRIAARVTNMAGQVYMTPEVRVKLRRDDRSVKMYRATDVPEAFGVRIGRRKECKIVVDGALENARAARLVLSTWSAAHGDEIGMNGSKLAGAIGLVHNYSFDSLPVPVRNLRRENTIHIFSNTKEHALEVNWPGPVLLVEYGPPALRPAAWGDAARPYRIPLEANAAGFARVDKPVEAAVDFAAALRGLGVKGAFDPRTLRVVETGADGSVMNADVPFQYDEGTLTWLMEGRTAAHATRRYAAYFGAGNRQSTPALAVADDVPYEGQASVRVTTPAGVYTYQKEGAGFASLRDPQGAEWIGYRPGGRAAGEFRGIPNLGKPFGHPGYTGESGSVTRVVSRGPLKVRLLSERRDRKWAAAWDIFPHYARLTVLRNDGPYWFLYEGTPGGKLDLENGFQLLPGGKRISLAQAWNGDMQGSEWAAFGGNGSKRVLYVANHQDDGAPDQYYQMDGEMTVFGFGREYRCCGQYLDWSPAEFTVGFAEATEFNAVAEAVNSAWRPLRVRAGAPERRP
ncbi:MAG TPA: hypothetical protein VN442_26250 [Bryobacteraceae bacterium]|nr:hypothetical protein [Bryobacteraceae bacterium]